VSRRIKIETFTIFEAASNQIKTAGFDLTAIEWEESP